MMCRKFEVVKLLILFICFSTNNFAQKISYESGIKVVENGKEGVWGKNPQIKLEYEGKFGNHNDKDQSTWFKKPTDIGFDNQGNIYVLDGGEHKIKKYDKNGKFLFSFGRKGRGPGEMIIPDILRVGSNGNIYLYDYALQRISKYSQDGKPTGSINQKYNTFKFEMLGGDAMVASNPALNGGGAYKPIFFHFDGNGKKIREYGEGPNPKGSKGNPTGAGSGMNNITFAIDKNMNTYAAYKFADRIDKFDKDGKLILRIKTAPQPFKTNNYGIVVDSKQRIWLLTMVRRPRSEEIVKVKKGVIDLNNGVDIRETEGDKSIVTTDMYALELYDKEGRFLIKYQLKNFISINDIIRISSNKIYILEDMREGTFHVYKISDL